MLVRRKLNGGYILMATLRRPLFFVTLLSLIASLFLANGSTAHAAQQSNIFVGDALTQLWPSSIFRNNVMRQLFAQEESIIENSSTGNGLRRPYALAIDAAGTVYVADAGSHSILTF